MEMNPNSAAFQRIFNNPFAFAAFKSTEPHLAGECPLLFAACASCGIAAHLQQPLCVRRLQRSRIWRVSGGSSCLLRGSQRPHCGLQAPGYAAIEHVAQQCKLTCKTHAVSCAEYISLDLHAAYTEAGFEAPGQLESTPRHRSVVGVKPRA